MTRIDIGDPDVDMDRGRRVLYRGGNSRRARPKNAWRGQPRAGLPIGVSKEWHPDGTLAAERAFVEDELTLLADRKWAEEGRQTKNWRKDEG
ncbi:hypothetical protein OG763_28810 [Streptomyces sp. NBC_01230]|uniref:hypothetical protein n=1 Tax=unclassified Streptomyces TaxID=2593676 RepID=UPI002E164679|nr:hypothetical protein OG763_28810 [Streptomyces sp. NBC_01230]